MINLIQKIVLLIIDKKGKGSFYLSESSEESDLVKIFILKEWKAVPYKQWREVQTKKIKWLIVWSELNQN